jgi:hypothetical protein
VEEVLAFSVMSVLGDRSPIPGDGGVDFGPGPVAVVADVAQLASGSDCLDPAEGFLDPFADPLRHGVADVAGGAPIDRGSSIGVVLRDARSEPGLAHISDEVHRVVVPPATVLRRALFLSRFSMSVARSARS